MATYGKMDSYGNKYSLADMTWEKDGDGLMVRSIFKMIPSVHAFNPMKKYALTLDGGLNYTGLFRYYIYKKEKLDSPLIRVYLEFKIDEGVIVIPEDSVQGFVRV